jgi:UDP-GlcNAc3NAcA epimerase
LLCPTQVAIENLAREGVTQGVHNVGDVMYDVALYYRERAKAQSKVLQVHGLHEKGFALATCHRAENTDDPARLEGIVSALAEIAIDMPVVLPLHPRTRKLLQQFGLEHHLGTLIVVDPLPFLDMVALEQAAKMILTDSGGVQKEAFFYQVPCITMRDETEWVETVELGWNRVVGASREAILAAYAAMATNTPEAGGKPYGEGRAAERILALITDSARV